MRRYETFNPAIPEEPERPIGDNLPAFNDVQPSTTTSAKSSSKKKKPDTPKIKKTKKKEEGPGVWESITGFFQSRTLRWIIGLFLGLFAVYLGIAFMSYFVTCVKDQSEINNTPIGYSTDVANAAGEGGARLSEFLINEFFGLGSFVIIIWLFAIGLRMISGKPRFKPVNFTIKCLVALITLSLIVGLFTIGLQSTVNWGGYHGRYVNEFIIHFLGWSGAVILCVFMVCCFIGICMRDMVKWILKKKAAYDEKRRLKREEEEARKERERELEEMRRAEDLAEHGPVDINSENEDIIKDDNGGIVDMSFDHESGLYDELPELEDLDMTYNLEEKAADSVLHVSQSQITSGPATALPENEDDKADKGEETTPNQEITYILNDLDSPEPEEPSNSKDTSLENLKKKGAESPSHDKNLGSVQKNETSVQDTIQAVETTDPLPVANTPPVIETAPPVNIIQSLVDNEHEKAPQADELEMKVNVNSYSQVKGKSQGVGVDGPGNFPYKFPPFELMAPGITQISVDAEEQLANKEQIRRTLMDFDIPIVSIEATVGPTVTLYEIVPDKGIRVAKIRSLADDISLSLSAEQGVRIIAPIPGKGTVGIEVANKDKQTVSMRTVLKSPAFQETKFKLPVALGSTISNEVFVADLAKMPHLLVAGATGQGKSVGLNAIITSLLYSKRPDELKFVMVDPKMVEFSLYASIEGHYLAKIPDAEDAIITDMDKVKETLNSLCIEMDNRYQLLKEAACRTIVEYNEKIKAHKLNPEEGHRFLPYIVVVVDEFSDLIMTAGKEVEQPIARLAQKARAVGMHVILATQRPSANVITGIIKANFPARIAFKVSSGVDSKTILDTTGAQQLIGRGDMLISNNGPMVRVQCAFIDTPEVEKICEHIAAQPYAQGAYLLPDPPSGKGDVDFEGGSGGGNPGDRDPLFEEVARLVVQTNNASTSSIQRRYRIGYNRAGSIMDQLEAAGIVGPAQGGKPRSVLMDPVSLDMLLDS